MLKFYYSTAPNPTKVALFLEEAGLDYEPIPVDTRIGNQHKSDFLAINPNAKVPVIVDGDEEKNGEFRPLAAVSIPLKSPTLVVNTHGRVRDLNYVHAAHRCANGFGHLLHNHARSPLAESHRSLDPSPKPSSLRRF